MVRNHEPPSHSQETPELSHQVRAGGLEAPPTPVHVVPRLLKPWGDAHVLSRTILMKKVCSLFLFWCGVFPIHQRIDCLPRGR